VSLTGENPVMLRLTALVISIGLADSLNPSTIAPALFLATGRHARRQVAEFTFGVFAVYLLGGLAIALGPGQLILSLVPHPDAEDRYVVEIVAGVAIVTAAVFLWAYRGRLAKRNVPMPSPEGRSSGWLGAVITAVELPTAFPYFAAIAAIVGSGFGVIRQALLLVLFNVCFVLPLLGILATVTFAGERSEQMLAWGRERLEARWPAVLAGLALLAGAFVILLGATGLVGLKHGSFPRFLRKVRRLLHP
jgi:cytochrome c biogenesis protein CcdA